MSYVWASAAVNFQQSYESQRSEVPETRKCASFEWWESFSPRNLDDAQAFAWWWKKLILRQCKVSVSSEVTNEVKIRDEKDESRERDGDSVVFETWCWGTFANEKWAMPEQMQRSISSEFTDGRQREKNQRREGTRALSDGRLLICENLMNVCWWEKRALLEAMEKITIQQCCEGQRETGIRDAKGYGVDC